MGRIDDVLNVSGHRLGTMEVESALVAHEMVAEAAVVGRPDDTTGEAVVAFVVLKRNRPEGEERPRPSPNSCATGWARKSARSPSQGHPLRRQPAQDPFGQDHAPPAARGRQGRGSHPDVSTLENPAILEQLAAVVIVRRPPAGRRTGRCAARRIMPSVCSQPGRSHDRPARFRLRMGFLGVLEVNRAAFDRVGWA